MQPRRTHPRPGAVASIEFAVFAFCCRVGIEILQVAIPAIVSGRTEGVADPLSRGRGSASPACAHGDSARHPTQRADTTDPAAY